MTAQTTQNDAVKVFPSDFVAAHIQGQQKAEQYISSLSYTCPSGNELCNLLGIDAMEIPQAQKSYFTGFCRTIQKALERQHAQSHV
jgi:hypothetical protein